MAGDLPNRDITAGAPDAIVDMKYGNSYTPTIMKAYKGSTLIYERQIEEWLYEINDVDCTSSPNIDTYASIQPENIYYIDHSIQPFSYSNYRRDWEFLIKATPTTGTAADHIFRVITSVNGFGNDHPEFIEDYIGGDEVVLEIRYQGHNKLGIYGTNGKFAPYSGNDVYNGNIDNTPELYDRDIRIVKQMEEENGEEVHKIYFYVSGSLVNTLVMTPTPITTNARVGSIMRTNNNGFVGNVKYMKFRFNSNPGTFEFDEYDIIKMDPGGAPKIAQRTWEETISHPTGAHDIVTHTVFYGTTNCAGFKSVEVYDKYGTLKDTYGAVEYSNRPGNSSASSEDVNIYPIYPGDGVGRDMPPSLYGRWKDIYDEITDTTRYDGFGIEFRPTQTGGSYIDRVTYTDINGNLRIETLGVNESNLTVISDYYSPFIFNGGLGTNTYDADGSVYVLYDHKREGQPESNQVYMLGKSLDKVFSSRYTTKVIYFHNLQQAIAFNSDIMEDIGITSKYKNGLDPNVIPTNASWIMYGGNAENYSKFIATTHANKGSNFRLFGIKFKHNEEED